MSNGQARTASATLESLRGTLSMERLLASGGRAIDLTGLDREAASLCTMILSLPGSAARALRPDLEVLLREVESLALTLPAPEALR